MTSSVHASCRPPCPSHRGPQRSLFLCPHLSLAWFSYPFHLRVLIPPNPSWAALRLCCEALSLRLPYTTSLSQWSFPRFLPDMQGRQLVTRDWAVSEVPCVSLASLWCREGVVASLTWPSEGCTQKRGGWGLWGPWAHREPAWCRGAPQHWSRLMM